MHGSRQHINDFVSQELRLPQINADACVHALIDQANCRACVDACPKLAWRLDETTLGLDTGVCDGCGLCVPACPTGALHITYPWVIRRFQERVIALFACEHSDIGTAAETLPCIHALGLRQLLLLYNAGIRHLLVTTGECANCRRGRSADLRLRVAQLNELLHERRSAPVILLQRSKSAWMRIYAAEEITSHGTRLSRRKFLGGGAAMVREQLLLADPLNLPECRTFPPGRLLPVSPATHESSWPWTPRLQENLCSGCDACLKLCPTDALQLLQKQSADLNAVVEYRVEAAACTGCGICTTVCETGAVSVQSWSRSTERIFISLRQRRCSACGNSYHQPRSVPQEPLCPVCRIHNHSSKLFQVLT